MSLRRLTPQGAVKFGLPAGTVVRRKRSVNPNPEPVTNDQLRQSLLGITTGQFSGLEVNSGTNPSGRQGRYGDPNGYQLLSDETAAQRGVGFDIMTGWQYQNKSFNNSAHAGTYWNDLKGMQVLDWFDSKYPTVLGMKPFPTGGSYTDAKNGLYDAELVEIGKTIAAKRPAGTGMVWLRLGWEGNANWYDHAAFNSDWSLKADYVAGTQRIISKIREGANGRVKFVQNWSATTSLRWQSIYWGDAYADAISADVYDAYAGTSNGIHTRAHLAATGFLAMYDFARAHGKLFGVDEWGGHGTSTGDGAPSNGGDNPDFQQVMWDWFQEVRDNLLWELQFNENTVGNVENNLWLTGGNAIQLPNARAKHIELWTGTAAPEVDATPLAAKAWDDPNWKTLEGPDNYAHYFTAGIPRNSATPVGTNTVAGHYYEKYQPPGFVEGATDHRRYGGFWRDFPRQGDLGPTTTGWELADMKWEIREAQKAGINGWTMNMLSIIGYDGSSDTNGHWTRMKRAMSAAEQVNAEDGTNFRIMPMPDGTAGWATALIKNADGTFDEDGSVAALANAISQLAASPAISKINNKVTIGPFAPESWPANITGRTAAQRKTFWTKLKSVLLSTYGLDVNYWFCYVAEWTGTTGAPLFDSLAFGHGRWGDRDYASVIAANVNNRGAAAKCRGDYGKPWMHFGGTPGDTRPPTAGATQYRTWESRGTRTIEGSWLAAIDSEAEMNQVVTWNDFSENAHVCPSRANGYAVLDLESWWAAKYRTGSFPVIKRDRLYLSHRAQRSDAAWDPASLQTAKSVLAGNTAIMNEIEVRAFAKDAGTLEIYINGNLVKTETVSAGVSIHNYPLPTSGTISARMRRAGEVVPGTPVVSTIPVRSSIMYDDYKYKIFSSGRQIAEPVAWPAVTAMPEPVENPEPTYSSEISYTETDVIEYSSGWMDGVSDKYTTTAGSEMKFSFNGTRFGLYGTKDTHHGTADVYVDGAKVGSATQTGTVRVTDALIFASGTLASGNHEVRVVTTAPTIGWFSIGVQGTFIDLPQSVSLFSSDIGGKSTPALAYDFNYVNPDYVAKGSLATSSNNPDGSGKVFRSVLDTATHGYRAHNELDAPFPLDEVWYEHWFRFNALGSLMDNQDAKIGFGLVGAPAGITSQDAISSGGDMIATSFSERMTISRPGYINGADPGGLAAYIYAYYADGRSYSSYGIRVPYRNNGQPIIPTAGTWYKKKVQVRVNTPGQNNGLYKIWINDVLVVDLDDVQWRPSGQNTKIGYLWTQTFSNATLATSAQFDQSNIKLYGSDPASSAPPTETSAYDNLILSDEPVAYYPMGGPEDLVGGRTATFTGSPAPQSVSGENYSLFNGVNQYATVEDDPRLSIPTTGELTVELWIRPDVTTFPNVENDDYIHILGKGQGTQDEYKMRMYNLVNSEDRPNRISFYAFNLPGSTGTGSYFQDVVNPGEWIHVTAVYNITAAAKADPSSPNGYVRIYKNGVQRDKDDLFATVPVIPEDGTAPLRIGTSDMESFFQGGIGKVAIYDKELPAARILAHAQATPYS